MRNPTEPVVVTIHPQSPEPRSAVLADVLVVIAEDSPSSEWCINLFVRYPGLTLLLVVSPDGEILAHFRDRTVLKLSTVPPCQPSTERIARFLYYSWAWGGAYGD